MLNLLLTLVMVFFFIWGLDKAGVINADDFTPVMLSEENLASPGNATEQTAEMAAPDSTMEKRLEKIIPRESERFTDRIFAKNQDKE